MWKVSQWQYLAARNVEYLRILVPTQRTYLNKNGKKAKTEFFRNFAVWLFSLAVLAETSVPTSHYFTPYPAFETTSSWLAASLRTCIWHTSDL